jgi:nitroreductase
MSGAKDAITRQPIHPLLRERWSPRAFADRPVDRETLEALLEAARWAPSSYNEQPWSFLVARRGEPDFERLLAGLVPGNQAWAKGAAVLMIALARTRFRHDGRLNRHAFYDLGQAAAHLTFQAAALGLQVHQMAGIDADKIRAEFQLPDDLEPATAIAIGYPGDPESLPEHQREQEKLPRQRKSLEEVVYAAPARLSPNDGE